MRMGGEPGEGRWNHSVTTHLPTSGRREHWYGGLAHRHARVGFVPKTVAVCLRPAGGAAYNDSLRSGQAATRFRRNTTLMIFSEAPGADQQAARRLDGAKLGRQQLACMMSVLKGGQVRGEG